MSRVSTCPKCTQPVAVPDGLEPTATVRCPTCEAEYSLAEVTAEPAEAEASGGNAMAFLKSLEADAGGGSGGASLPPELVPVATVVAESDSSAELPAGPADADMTIDDYAEDSEGITIESDEESEAGEAPEGDAAADAGEAAAPPEATPPEAAPPPVEPAAVVLPEGEAATAPSEAEAKEEEAPAAAEEPPPPPDLDPLVRGPHGEQEFHLSELIVASTGVPLGAVAASRIVRQDLLRPISEEEAHAAEAAAGTGEEAAALDYSSFAVRDEESAAETEGETGAAPARPRRKRKEKNPVKEMIGVVVGGALGLLIGYYLLNVFGGQRFDFAEVYLPGVKHTYKHAPPWLPPWARFGMAGEAANGDEEPPAPDADKGPAKKPAAQKPPAEKPGPAEPPQPGEKPAETPVEKPEEKPGEKPSPAPGEKTPPKPAPKPSDGIELAGAPSFVADDLGKALKEANDSLGCKACNSTGKVTKTVTEIQEVGGEKKEVKKEVSAECDACKGQPSKAMTDAAYDKFCDLAEVLTFVKGAEDQGQLGDRKRAARTVLQTVAGEPGSAEKIGELAAARLDDGARLNTGVVLAGKIEKTAPQGAWHVTELTLARSGKAVTVLSRGSPPAIAGDQVAVLGSIVDEPKGNLGGYDGDKAVVVVAGTCVKAP